MSDKVVIKGLRVFGHHGVTEQERKKGQDLVVDLECTVDTAAAGSSDDLTDTVDYGVLTQDISVLVETQSFHLLEALAEQIAALALKDDLVSKVKVSVAKPAPPLAQSLDCVQVQIKRAK